MSSVRNRIDYCEYGGEFTGCEIGVESEDGKGSKFTITLPISVKISFSIRCSQPDQQEEQSDAQRSPRPQLV